MSNLSTHNKTHTKEEGINKLNKEALQVTKELTVKFIETQRITPTNFVDIFPTIHKVVLETLRKGQEHEL